MDWLSDDRTVCWSVLTTMAAREYLEIVELAHRNRGGIEGQRDVLKTTTAKRIRDRMVSDIKLGAVLPPVVLGAVVDDELFNEYPLADIPSPMDLIPKGTIENVAIIDGMQRTSALLEAAGQNPDVLERKIRVEFWLTRTVRALIYRMLVLNTGQVPWTISRQLTVIYAPLIAEVRANVPEIERLFGPDKAGRRVGPAQFQSNVLVELYLAFSLRKTTVDTKETLSEEFSRLDFVQNLSTLTFQDQFYTALGILAELDKAFSKYDPGPGGPERYARGRSVFDSQPARIGFITSLAQHVLGRPGLDRETEERTKRIDAVKQASKRLIDRLKENTPEEVGEFLKLDVLRETLDRRTGQVGRFERAVFFDAFKVLIEENFELRDMEPCWRAH